VQVFGITIATTIIIIIIITIITIVIIHFPYFTAVQLVLQTVLTKNFLFTVMPKTFLTVRHVLSIAALCRKQGEDEQFQAVV
jgi:hypothetical protein